VIFCLEGGEIRPAWNKKKRECWRKGGISNRGGNSIGGQGLANVTPLGGRDVSWEKW